jgi:hypothetical protein
MILLQSLQTRNRLGFYLGLRPVSWAVIAIGLLAHVDICGIVTSL